MALTPMLPEVTSFLSREHGHYINGELFPGQGSERINVRNPAK